MAIMVHLTPSDCEGCFSAYRPTTNERGVIEKQHIPKRVQKEVELKGSAYNNQKSHRWGGYAFREAAREQLRLLSEAQNA